MDLAAIEIARADGAAIATTEAEDFRRWAIALGDEMRAASDIEVARKAFSAASRDGVAFERREALKAAAGETLGRCRAAYDEYEAGRVMKGVRLAKPLG